MKTKRAFTLIEVLVVVGIIALLAAIIFPAFQSAREKGRSAACQSNLKQLGAAMTMYTQDYERYPRGLDPSDKFTPQIWQSNPAYQAMIAATPLLPEVMAPYIQSAAVWKCPSDSGFDITDTTGQPLNARPTCFDAPRPDNGGTFGMSYFYRTEITFLNLLEDHLARPAETNVLQDGDGGWHGASVMNFNRGRRYNLLFGDGHVKNVNRDAFDAAWSTPLQ